MATWIALLRGINVGGRNVVPMNDLRRALTDAGLDAVQTYIQSGNVVFDSPRRSARALAATIEEVVARDCGVAAAVHVLAADRLASIAGANPFPDAPGNRVHMLFLMAPSKSPDLEALEALRSASEAFHLTSDAFYLHAPDGIGRSKLAARAEHVLGVRATGRNARTVGKLLAMAAQ